jgi:Ribbon-helix-helix protein, copG family
VIRINARLDDDLARKVEDLMRAQGKSVTEIIKASIAHYYAASCGELTRPTQVLKRTKFIGCAEGPSTLSRDYKRTLAKSLARKHGHR